MRWSLRIGFVAFISFAVSPYVIAQGPTLQDPAIQAARKRQEAVKTFDVRFKRTEVFAKGAQSTLETFPTFKPKGIVPLEETTLESENRVVMDGLKSRCENNHPAWLMPDGIVEKRTLVNTADGAYSKYYYATGPGGNSGPEGIIDFEPRSMEIKLGALAPLTMTFRGLEPSIAPLPLSDFHPTGVELPIKSALCFQYADKSIKDQTYTLWLDSAKDYVVRRVQCETKAKLTAQWDIEYSPHESCGWVPQSWHYSDYSATGAILITRRFEVLKLDINTPQAADRFEIEFPPGCKVSDNRVNKTYRVQSDGSMRETTRRGEDLDNTVWQPGTPWYRRHLWLIVSFAGATMLLILVYLVSRRRGPRPIA